VPSAASTACWRSAARWAPTWRWTSRNALPLGLPKVVLSTVAHSHLIPPERVPPDLIMRLWAGGLYGLNRLCRTALAQAAGAVVGACRATQADSGVRPVIGMTSLGQRAEVHDAPETRAGIARLRAGGVPHHRHGRPRFRGPGGQGLPSPR
jgi:hypothetical protein